MHQLRKFGRFLSDRAAVQSGQALIEYALIIALVAVIAVVALAATGTSVSSVLNTVANQI